jgi:serpin B
MASCTCVKVIGAIALVAALPELLPCWRGTAMGSDVEPAVAVEGSNAFALELYQRVRRESSGNIACSPFSITEALAMTYTGARGPTKDQIARVMHFRAGDDLHRELADLRRALTGGTGHSARLQIANRLWVQRGLDVLPSFMKVLEDSYGASPGVADFVHDYEVARRAMNGWVEETTAGRIKNLLGPDDINPHTRMVLTNAIAFEGKWENPFNPRWTKPAPFHVPGGEPIEVPLMTQESRFRYASLPVVKVVEKSYGEGRFAMLILLPANESGGLDRLEQALDAKTLKAWNHQLEPRDVLFSMPKFRGASRYELSQVLSRMGMTLAFKDEADFSGITSSEHLSLARVVHEAVVEVDEQGTKAYASTGASQEARTLPIIFRADRPFLYFIIDRSTDLILFLGRVTNPVQHGG